MNQSLIAFSEELKRAPDLESLWSRTLEALRAYGITGLIYGAAASRNEIEAHGLTRSVIWKSNYPKEFFEAFGCDEFLDDDPSAWHCIEDSSPVLWHQEQKPALSKREKVRLDAERDLGFAVGFTVPASHFGRGLIGGIGAKLENVSATELEQIWKSRSVTLLAMLGMLDARMRACHLPDLIGLSGRERDCLTWLASGLRPDQIAERLGIGYRSIDKYINSARRKLNATTRDQAVAKALLFKAIEP